MNGIDLILADHERVNLLFARFDDTGDATLIGEIVDALVAHDQAEQATLYPLAGSVLNDAEAIEHYDRAHSAIKKAIEHLVGLEGPPLVEAVAVLRTRVEEHVAEEEADLLPALTKAATIAQLDGLGARILQNKQRAG
ncbi:MAG TPA: hemerythrin domain-containing protein [Acidimicrobiia bacterium]|jgi:hemerythrin superfamily protein|nr:hemerythrin domain-containing protein [Acidimicrobiia bacterium]